ncbi:unnamed protein product, partial [Polarella glacialis]
ELQWTVGEESDPEIALPTATAARVGLRSAGGETHGTRVPGAGDSTATCGRGAAREEETEETEAIGRGEGGTPIAAGTGETIVALTAAAGAREAARVT